MRVPSATVSSVEEFDAVPLRKRLRAKARSFQSLGDVIAS